MLKVFKWLLTLCFKTLAGVDAAWSGKAEEKKTLLLSKIGSYKIFNWDIARLAPGRELESEVGQSHMIQTM